MAQEGSALPTSTCALGVVDFPSHVDLPGHSADQLRMLVDDSGISFDDILKDFIKDQVKIPGSSVNAAVTKGFLQKLSDRVEFSSKSKRIRVPFQLTSVQKNKLMDSYPSYKLIFQDRTVHGHAMAAASRLLEMHYALDMMGYDPVAVPAGHTFTVKDVGGNAQNHFKLGHTSVHSCCPTISVEDNSRANKRKRFIDTNKNFRAFLNDHPNFFCTKRAEECRHTAQMLLFIHSLYDIPIDKLCDIFTQSTAVIGVGTFIWDVRMLFLKSGYIEDLKCSWSISSVRTRDGKKYNQIRYAFRDGSNGYVHNFDTIRSIMTSTVIKNKRNDFGLHVELGALIMGIQYVTFTVMSNSPCAELRVRSLDVQGLADHLVITYWDMHPDARTGQWFGKPSLRKLKKLLIPKMLIVHKQFWQALVLHGMSAKEGTFILTSLIAFAKSANSRRTFNAQDVRNAYDYDPDLVIDLCTAAYYYCYVKRWQQTQTVQLMGKLTEILRAAKFDSKVMRLWKFLTQGIPYLDTNPIPPQGNLETCADGILNGEYFEEMYSTKMMSFYAGSALTPVVRPVEIFIQEVVCAHNMPMWDVSVENLDVSNDVVERVFEDARTYAKVFKIFDSDVATDVSVDGTPVTNGDETPTAPVEEDEDVDKFFDAADVVHQYGMCGDFDLVKCDGDGSCGYAALIASAGLTLSPAELQDSLLNYALLNPQVSTLKSREVLSSDFSSEDGWMTHEVIEVFCAKYKCRVCIHDVTGVSIACIGKPETTLIHHVRYTTCHFDALVRVRTVTDRIVRIGATFSASMTVAEDLVECEKKYYSYSRKLREAAEYDAVASAYLKKDVVAPRQHLIIDWMYEEFLLFDDGQRILMHGCTPGGYADSLRAGLSDLTITLLSKVSAKYDDSVVFDTIITYSDNDYIPMLRNAGMVNVIVSDDFDCDECSDDEFVAKIVMVIRLCNMLLEINGNLVVRMPFVTSVLRVNAVAWITTCFRECYAVKPSGMRILDRAMFLVCKGYTGNGITITDECNFIKPLDVNQSAAVSVVQSVLYYNLKKSLLDSIKIVEGIEYRSRSLLARIVAYVPTFRGGSDGLPLDKWIKYVRSSQFSASLPPLLIDDDFDMSMLKILIDSVAGRVKGEAVVRVDVPLHLARDYVVGIPVRTFAEAVNSCLSKIFDNVPGYELETHNYVSKIFSKKFVSWRLDTFHPIVNCKNQTGIRVITNGYVDKAIQAAYIPYRDNTKVAMTVGDSRMSVVDTCAEALEVVSNNDVSCVSLAGINIFEVSYARGFGCELVNAMREQRAIWKTTASIIMDNMILLEQKFPVRSATKMTWQSILAHEKSTCVIASKDTFLFKGEGALDKPDDFKYGFKNGKLVKIETCRDFPIYTNKYLKVFNEPDMYESSNSASEDIVSKISIVQGVPGCGKTKFIIDNAKVGDLILTSTREGKEDLVKRLSKAYPSRKFDNVKTIDSYIMHAKPNVTFNTVWIDEAFMRHAGSVVIAASLARAVNVHCLGDLLQIPYIERTTIIKNALRYDKLSVFCPISKVLNVSYRCPGDVARLFTDQYRNIAGHDFISKSKIVNNSMKVLRITGASMIPRIDGAKYITFTQADKFLMQQAKFDVSTMHEFQGKQAKIIVLVRLDNKDCDLIYDSPPHVLVAMTRHTNEFLYCTVKDNDYVSRQVFQSHLHVGFVETRDEFDMTSESIQTLVNNYGACVGVNPRVVIDDDYKMFAPKLVMHEVDEVPGGAIEILQDMYESLVPDSAHVEMYHDPELIATSDLAVYGFEGSCATYENLFKQENFDKLQPVLKTSMYYPRARNQDETLIAINKRNLNVPNLANVVPTKQLVDGMVKEFFNAYVDMEKFTDACKEELMLSRCSIDDWLRKQPSDVLDKIDHLKGIDDYDWAAYELSLKVLPKPNMTEQSTRLIPPLQTIAAHPKFINALFCPIVKLIKERFLASLRDNTLVFTDMSTEEFARKLDSVFPVDWIDGLDTLEIDISKYDKSQALLALEFEIEMLRRFGMPEFMLHIWRIAHTNTILKDYASKLKLRIKYQRKSGDAMTLLGNTWFCMATAAMAFDMEKISLRLFLGDDSKFWGKNFFTGIDIAEYYAGVFNLEVKVFQYKSHYFCSKFLLNIDGKWAFVPDPVKFLTKLGRHDVSNFSHLEEYRRSTRDLFGRYLTIEVAMALESCIAERYGALIDCNVMFSCFKYLLESTERFSTLFYVEKGARLCYDPSVIKFD